MGNTSVVNIEVRVDDKGSASIRQIGTSARTSANQAEAAFKGVGSTLEDMNRKAAAAWGSFRSGAGTALDMVFSLKTALLGLGLGLVARDALKTTAGFESMTMSLKTLTGSMEAAKAAAAWIERFTAKTPYQLNEVTEAYKKLLAYGFDPKKYLGPLGDAASALTKTLDDAVELVADASTGQFERLREFGMRASAEGGKVAISWRQNGQQMQTTVANTSEAITGHLLKIFSQYKGAMADQMEAWSGLWSNMMDVVSKFERQVMDTGPFQAMKAGLKDFLAYLDTEKGKMDLAQWALDMANAVMGAFQVMAGAAKLFIGYLETVRLAVNGVKEAWIQLGILAAKVDPLLDPKKYLFDWSQWKKRKEDLQGLNEELVATQIEGIKIFENWQNLDGAFDALKKSLEGMQAAGNAAARARMDAMKAEAGAAKDAMQAFAEFKALEREANGEVAAAAGTAPKTAAEIKKETQERITEIGRIAAAEADLLKAKGDEYGATMKTLEAERQVRILRGESAELANQAYDVQAAKAWTEETLRRENTVREIMAEGARAEQQEYENRLKTATGVEAKLLEVERWRAGETAAVWANEKVDLAAAQDQVVAIEAAAAAKRTQVEKDEAARRAQVEADYQAQIADIIRDDEPIRAAELSYQARIAALDAWYAKELETNKDVAGLDELYAAKRRQINEEAFASMALAGDDFVAGMTQAFKELADAAYTFGKAGYDAVKNFAQAGEQLLEDVLVDGLKGKFDSLTTAWRSFTDSMYRMFAAAVAKMAMQQVVLPVVAPVFTSMFGGTATAAGATISGGAAGAGGAGGLGNLQSIYSAYSGLSGAGFGGAPMWGAAGSGLGGLLGGALPGTGYSVYGIGAASGVPGITVGFGGLSLGAAMGAGALGGLGYSMLGPLVGLPQSPYSGLTAGLGGGLGAWGGAALGGVGSLAGTMLGSIAMPIIGTILGALGGGLLGSLFGGGEKSVEDLDLHYIGGSAGKTAKSGARSSGRHPYTVYAGDFGEDFGNRKQGEDLEKATIAYLDSYFTSMEDAFDIDLDDLIGKMDFDLQGLEGKQDLSEIPEQMLRKLFKNYLDDWKGAIASSGKAYATTLVSGFEDISDQHQMQDWLDKALQAIPLAEGLGQTIAGWMHEYGLTLGGMLSELPADASQQFQDLYGPLFKQKTGLERAADQINAELDATVRQLEDLGVDQAFIDGVEAMRDDLVAAAMQAIRDEWNWNLDQRELAAAGLSGEAAARARAKGQKDEVDAAIDQFGEGSAEVARLLAIQAAENDALARSMADSIAIYQAQVTGNQEGAAWLQLQAAHQQKWNEAIAAGVGEDKLEILRQTMELENQLFALQWEFAKRERSETLHIRMLRAQGHDEEADAAQQALDNEKELLQARLDGWSAQDIAMLKAVQEAEAAQRAQEKAAAAAKEYADAIARANERFADFRTSIQDWLNSKLTEESPGTSPESRLAAAQDQFWATYQKAQNGDWQAAESMTGLADTYLDTLEAMYGSTAQYQTERQQILEAMKALPNQKLYEQAVLDELKDISTSTTSTATNTGEGGAVTSALGGIPEELRGKLTEAIEDADVDYSGGMNSSEFQKFYENNQELLGKLMGGVSGKSVGELFKILDGDGDGQITPLEIENYTGAAGQDADLQAARELTTNQMLAAHAVQLTAIVHNTAAAAGAKGWEGTGWTNPFADNVLMNYWPTRNSWIKALAGESLYTRASGGPVWPGQPFLVGEEGPEFFIPQSSGTILDAATSRGLAGNVAGGDMGLPILRELQATNRLLTARLDQSSRENEGLKTEIKTLAGEVKELKKATKLAAERRAVK